MQTLKDIMHRLHILFRVHVIKSRLPTKIIYSISRAVRGWYPETSEQLGPLEGRFHRLRLEPLVVSGSVHSTSYKSNVKISDMMFFFT